MNRTTHPGFREPSRRTAAKLFLSFALAAASCAVGSIAQAQNPSYYSNLEVAPPSVPNATSPNAKPSQILPPPLKLFPSTTKGTPDQVQRLPETSGPRTAAISGLPPAIYSTPRQSPSAIAKQPDNIAPSTSAAPKVTQQTKPSLPTAPVAKQIPANQSQRADSTQTTVAQPVSNTNVKPQDDYSATPEWSALLTRPVLGQAYTVPISIEQLTIEAMRCSLQLRVNYLQPQIENETVARAAAAFDWNSFLSSKWQETNTPSSTSLTTGGPFIFKDHQLQHEAGLTKKTVTGADVRIGQAVNSQMNNSTFFNPPHQSTTQLRVNFTQPLLRGAGQYYNRSIIVLSEIRADVSRQTAIEQMQDHLLNVNQAYWDLYFARGNWMRQEKLYQQALRLAQQLKTRENVDGAKDQILRAETTAAQRRATLVRAQKQVLDLQARLRLLVNAPLVMDCTNAEFVTVDSPLLAPIPVTLQDAFATAVQYRPEIVAALQRIQDARVRLNVAENEILPSLNLIMEGYLNGLRGQYDIAGSLRDQFTEVDPGYLVGVEMKTPIGQRSARATQRKTSLERSQLEADFHLTNERVWQEVAAAYRELQTSYRETLLNLEASRTTSTQLDYLEKRRELIPLNNGSSSLFLQDVFRAQEQSANADLAYLRSQITYAQAVTNLKRTMGYLLTVIR